MKRWDRSKSRQQGGQEPCLRSHCQLPSRGAEATSFLAIVLPLLMLGLTANSHFLADSFPTLQGTWKEALMSWLPPPLPSKWGGGGLQMVPSRRI